MQDRDAFSLKLEDTETWLYEDGEDQQKQVYIDKLAELKVTRHEVCDWTVVYKWNCYNCTVLGRVFKVQDV